VPGLDEICQLVSVANSSTLNLGSSNFTVMMWVKRNALGGGQRHLFSKCVATGWESGCKEFYFAGDTLTFGSYLTGDTVSVNVDISLEMPSWTPPSTMLPKARAEWTRWFAALAAHEQGHIKLVHDVHDGISKKILGKAPKAGETLFNTAKASLATKSTTYDTTTDHGLKTGTVLNVGIEQQELDEEKKKQEEAAKAKSRTSAVPDVPEDE